MRHFYGLLYGHFTAVPTDFSTDAADWRTARRGCYKDATRGRGGFSTDSPRTEYGRGE